VPLVEQELLNFPELLDLQEEVVEDTKEVIRIRQSKKDI
jgi:hypothetical protein